MLEGTYVIDPDGIKALIEYAVSIISPKERVYTTLKYPSSTKWSIIINDYKIEPRSIIKVIFEKR